MRKPFSDFITAQTAVNLYKNCNNSVSFMGLYVSAMHKVCECIAAVQH